MANIQPQIDFIRTAKLGRDVRESIASGMEAMNGESSTAYSAAITAQNSASNSAQQAAQSASDADNAQQAASNSATNAAGSASEAAQSATNAAQSATNAAGSASSAQSALIAVTQQAQAAANAASNAAASETNAENAAARASASAEDANTARLQAMQSATNAQTSATTASNAQTAAGISATNAAASEQNAYNYAQQAQAAANVEIATTTKPGIVMPDGTTVTVDQFGRISIAGLAEHIAQSIVSPNGVHGVRIYKDPTTELIALQQWDTVNQVWVNLFDSLKPDGDTITMDADGTLHATAYELPTASATTKGGVKVGDTLEVDNEVLNVIIDDELKAGSENPVQNKVITAEVKQLADDALNLKMLGWTVPKKLGINNYIGTDGKFHQRVGRVDLSKLNWQILSPAFDYKFSVVYSDVMRSPSHITVIKMICDKYDTITPSQIDGDTNGISSADWTSALLICDSNIHSVEALRAKLNNVYLYYELATEIVMLVDGNEITSGKLISDAWNGSGVKGQYYISDNTLWKCLADNTIKPIDDGANWRKTTIAEELTSKIVFTNEPITMTNNNGRFEMHKDGYKLISATTNNPDWNVTIIDSNDSGIHKCKCIGVDDITPYPQGLAFWCSNTWIKLN